MDTKSTFQKRISYTGDLKLLMREIVKEYNLGKYKSHQIIKTGYEDFNTILVTSNGQFFVKFFNKKRSKGDIDRYISMIKCALENSVRHPKLFSSKNGSLFHSKIEGKSVYACVMEYIEGDNYYDANKQLTIEEKKEVIRQAGIINKMSLDVKKYYDEWAIENFLDEFGKKGKYLSKRDKKLLLPLIEKFQKILFKRLPNCFVHGDLIKTNIIKSKKGKLYVIDFSCANIYHRIQELAVLLCDSFFDKSNLDKFEYVYNFTLSEYQKEIKLSKYEINTLPTFVKGAHAMHVLLGTYERKVRGNRTKENDYYIELGRSGLEFLLGIGF